VWPGVDQTACLHADVCCGEDGKTACHNSAVCEKSADSGECRCKETRLIPMVTWYSSIFNVQLTPGGLTELVAAEQFAEIAPDLGGCSRQPNPALCVASALRPDRATQGGSQFLRQLHDVRMKFMGQFFATLAPRMHPWFFAVASGLLIVRPNDLACVPDGHEVPSREYPAADARVQQHLWTNPKEVMDCTSGGLDKCSKLAVRIQLFAIVKFIMVPAWNQYWKSKWVRAVDRTQKFASCACQVLVQDTILRYRQVTKLNQDEINQILGQFVEPFESKEILQLAQLVHLAYAFQHLQVFELDEELKDSLGDCFESNPRGKVARRLLTEMENSYGGLTLWSNVSERAQMALNGGENMNEDKNLSSSKQGLLSGGPGTHMRRISVFSLLAFAALPILAGIYSYP